MSVHLPPEIFKAAMRAGANRDALRRIDQAQGTCSIVLEMPYIGQVQLRATDTRATEACTSADQLRRGERTFSEHLAEAIMLTVAIDADFAAWLATIPADKVEAVHHAVDGCVPPGHRCREGGPHTRVTIRHQPISIWAVNVTESVVHGERRAIVTLFGPGPS